MVDIELVTRIQRRLRITWDDADEFVTLTEQCESGIMFIDDIAGCEVDYSEDKKAFQMLYDYVRYIRSDCSELFAKNYLTDINSLRLKYRVKNAESGDDDDSEVTD